ncbi:MAG TPA: hypothetical protein DIW44_14710 [Anaerolineaceae bacterium]|nr:hypothetical protein [Anaerolineaceae bacterium]
MVYSILSIIAIVFAVLFILTLAVLHFLKPEFDPKWRMISEYEIGKYGNLMQGAFFSWGASLLFMMVVAWHFVGSAVGIIGWVWFLIIVLALVGAGIFKTNAITDNSTSRDNSIHTLCGSVVILTFPIASTLVASAFLRSPFWEPYTLAVVLFTVLNWLGMIGFFASIIWSRKKDPTAGRVGPKVLLGWPNRIMVLLYNAWIIVLAVCVIQMMK